MKTLSYNVLTFITLLCVIISFELQAQQKTLTGAEAQKICAGSKSVSFSENSQVPSFITFSEASALKAGNSLSMLKPALKISDDEKLVIYREEKDYSGFVHSRYQQYYKNVKVENGQYIVHEKDGYLKSANGVWIDNIDVSVTSSINEKEALQYALDFTKAKVYAWELAGEEAFVKNITNDAAATYYPKAEMVIVARDFDYKKHELHYCYKFDIYAKSPMSRNWVYVDASSGEIVATESRIKATDVPATANTMYSGIQPITTDSVSPGNYRLRETGRGLGIETWDLNKSTDLNTAVDFTNTTTFWNTSTNKDNAAYDAHWALESTYDYYLNVHGRNSFDNAGLKLRAYAHYGVNVTDAYHMPNGVMVFGDATGNAGGYNPFTSIDIVAHEFTHGVTEYSAGLHYGSESGALNESFSDIFGTCVEFYKKPLAADFLLAEEPAVTPGTYIRNLSNPNAKLHPDTYKGTYWITSGSDFGGVHSNSGVQNFWFYLLCSGGSGTNDIGNAFNVAAIGMNKAEKIAYRTLTVYLTSFSNYADARLGSIQAAEDLYGVCSAEVISTTNAWYAVGVGPAYSATVDASFVTDAVSSCTLPFDVHFTNTSSNATSYNWSFGDGATSNLPSPVHTYSNPGNYTVRLISTSSCGTDSVIMNSYININTPAPPTVTGGTHCGPGTVSLSANGSGTLEWYASSTGGVSINTGNNFVTPVLNSTTTYYVEDRIAGSSSNFGPTSWAGQYGSFQSQYLKFDAQQSFTLLSVKTQSYYAGTRNIVLRDNAGNVLQNIVINVPVGVVTIPLNIHIAAGTGYHLGGDTLGFAFDNFNNAYPISLPGVVSITGNTISPLFYLFFYDWHVKTDECVSLRTPVTAKILSLPSPVVTAGPDNPMPTICSGESTDIYASGASSYTWSPATGLSSTYGTLVMASPSVTTVYSVTGTNALGCSNTANITVTVNQTSLISIIPSSTLNICSGGSVQLTAGGATSYLWSPDTGLNSASGSSVVASPTTTTTYTVTGVNALGCAGTASITVTVSPTISVTVSPNQTICSGASLPLTASGATTYSWSPATGLSATTGANVTASPTTTTTYTVTGTSGGCTSSASVTITVAASITVSVTPSQAICNGNSLSLTATGAISYSWSPATGLSAITGSVVTASPSSTQTYTVTGTSANCSNTANVTLSVIPGPAITVNGNQTICNGTSVPLTAGGGITYNWTPAAGLSATTGANVNASPLVSTNYIVTGTNAQGCSATASTNVIVNPKPQVTVVSQPGGHDSIILCTGDSVKLFALGADSYTWMPATGLSQSTGSTVLAYPANTITYTISGTDLNGCSNNTLMKIIVVNCIKKAADGDVLTDFVRIFPNPFSDKTTVRFTNYDFGFTNVELKIYDVFGNEVRSIKVVDKDEIIIEKDMLKAGVYIYQLRNSSGNISQGKLMVQ